MSTPSRPLLGEYVDPADDSAELRRRIARLSAQLEDARAETREAQNKSKNAMRALQNLQRQLAPMYNALRAVFGEFELIGSSDDVPSQRVSGVWDSWKSKLGGKQAEFIQAMLDHGHPMTSEQLRVATHTGRSTVPQIIYKLNTLGLINKNGGKFSLKEL